MRQRWRGGDGAGFTLPFFCRFLLDARNNGKRLLHVVLALLFEPAAVLPPGSATLLGLEPYARLLGPRYRYTFPLFPTFSSRLRSAFLAAGIPSGSTGG